MESMARDISVRRPPPTEQQQAIRELLQNRNFRLLWVGQLLSQVGDNCLLIAAITLISNLSQSPLAILIPHVIIIFFAMFLSNRTALEAVRKTGSPYSYMCWTIGFFFVGGLILGPLVQKYAFGAFWTGFPFGTDLTDNKTLIAFVGWILALFFNRGERSSRGWILCAALLMLAVYLIPHSLLGSEIDYTNIPQ